MFTLHPSMFYDPYEEEYQRQLAYRRRLQQQMAREQALRQQMAREQALRDMLIQQRMRQQHQQIHPAQYDDDEDDEMEQYQCPVEPVHVKR
ncbi:hypothetical protein HDU76_005458, partial [Blyttiomyces sp. JEL0837]